MVANTIAEPEEWRSIAGYEGLYEVSNCGRVKSLPRWRANGNCGPIILKDADKKGYRVVCIRTAQGAASMKHVHRLVAAAFCEQERPEQTQVNHRNGVRSDNRACNLEWCTVSENHFHASKVLGTKSRPPLSLGELPRRHVLQVEDVRRIRAAVAAGTHYQRELAKEYGVHESTIFNVVHGKTWSQIN